MLQPGAVLGGMYQVIREIGKGGVGIIYLGYHLRLKKQVVIKKVKENVAGRINVRAEADILKNLHHSFLPQVYDFLEADGGIYTVMEYIPGENLQYYIDRKTRFAEETIRTWMMQLCAVLEYLHTRQPRILHSDIKPANIMVTPEGKIVLIDFNVSLSGEATDDLQGISRIYAAPEQYRAAINKLYHRPQQERLDERMDLYSLAAVFYHLMSGIRPDAEKGVPAPLTKMRLPYSPALRSVVDRAMMRDPRKRFKSAQQMGDALRNLEKMDPEYRRLGRAQIITAFSGAAVMLIGLFMVLAGWNLHVRDSWLTDYNAFADLCEDMADETEANTVVDAGEALLNNILYSGFLRSNDERTAQIENAIGEAYFYLERYTSAAQYFKWALEADGTGERYLRNYMTALIMDGESVDVDALTAAYPDAAFGSAEVYYIEAYTDYADGAYEEALSACEKALEATSDTEILAVVCYLQAQICYDMEDMAGAAQAAVMTAEYDDSAEYIRAAGNLAALAAVEAQEDGDDTAYMQWLQTAAEYYEILCGEDDAAYADRFDYAILLCSLEEYEESISLLKVLYGENEDDYQIGMWLCYDYIAIAVRDDDLAAVESDLTYYYNACEQLYLKADTEDETMETLISYMKELGLY